MVGRAFECRHSQLQFSHIYLGSINGGWMRMGYLDDGVGGLAGIGLISMMGRGCERIFGCWGGVV